VSRENSWPTPKTDRDEPLEIGNPGVKLGPMHVDAVLRILLPYAQKVLAEEEARKESAETPVPTAPPEQPEAQAAPKRKTAAARKKKGGGKQDGPPSPS
jgi:hypothetical protein